MSFADTFLPEFDAEMASTRRLLERLPEDKFDWKCHPKSNTIGWNANHVAEIPGWIEETVQTDSFDVNPPGGPRYATPNLRTRRELLELLDANVASARKAIQQVRDEDLGVMWSLLDGGKPLITMPRGAVIRTLIMNHLIHHRAHLCVYLRMNDIPVPGMYGPSGDEDA